jgi:hypothetical protein
MPHALADERRVTVVLCDGDGTVLGQLPTPFVVSPRWWPEVDPVVAAVRERHGLVVTVLRLLTTDTDLAGGEVAYLAQVRSGPPTPTVPPDGAVAAALHDDATNRLWWAEPGGLDHLPDWVEAALRAHGRRRTGVLRQRKTWNLSVVVTAPTDQGEVWFKATPPFLADEGSVIRRVAEVDPDLVPTVLAHDPGRRAILMEHVSGQDEFGLSDEAVAEAMVRRWVGVQGALVDDIEHALAVGARDLRRAPLLSEVRDLLGRPEVRVALGASDLRAAEELVEGLPGRLDEIAACGLPDTVLHGDMHPGNWRRDGDRLTLLDWGDVGVGNPMVDQRAFVERLSDPALRERISALWAQLWAEQVPDADPARAAYLLGPVAQLAAAATYQRFLDHIEATERVYHALDPVDRLRAAIAADGERAY